jgi:hypothetical protein
VIVLAEKVFLGTVSSVMKLLRRRPWRMYRCDPIARTDEEDAGSEAYPMVLVQIPMYNEKEVCVSRTLLLAGSSVLAFLVNSDSCSDFRVS